MKYWKILVVWSVLLFCISCTSIVQAEEPLQVQVTATPATVSAGSSAQIQVTVTYYGQPMDHATVVANTNTGSATLTPYSGSTDSSGKASFRLDTTSSTSGTVRVSATVTKQTIDASYAGNGYADVQVQPFVAIPLQDVIVVPLPPAPQPQPQPYQPPAPQQPQPAVNQQPVAIIAVDKSTGKTPLTINFDGRSSYDPDGSISSYAWDFGDGTTGSGYIASHTYTTPGTFVASLVVTDDNGLPSNPATTPIIVQSSAQVQPQPVYQPPQPQPIYQPPQPVYQPPAPPQPQPAGPQAPVAIISVDNYAGNIPLTVNFDGQQSYAPGGSISSYAWNFGDGTTGSGYVASHTYTTPGTFTASLIVTDNNGLSSNPATTQIQGGIQVQQQQPVYHPPQQQQVYQPPPQPVNKQPVAPMTVINPAEVCDDGNKCTVDDYYDCNNKCNAGRGLNCDDRIATTQDTCDPSVGCVHSSMAQVLDVILFDNKCGGHSNFISINGEDIDQNSEIRVPVEGCNVKNLLLMTLNVDYNYVKQTGGDSNEYRNVLQFKRAEKGSLNDDAGFDAHQSHIADGKNTNDRISITFSSPSSSGYSGSGSIAVLVFDVIGSDRNITSITPTVTSATDIANHPIPVTTLGGTFIVRRWKSSGMVTISNAKVTTKDALAAQQMASGKRTANLRLDMNNDAKVDAADVATIQQIATGERAPVMGQTTAQGKISAKDMEIVNLIKTEQDKADIAGKIDRANHAFDVNLDAIIASPKKPAQNTGSILSMNMALPSLTSNSLLAQKFLSSLSPYLKNPATACLPPKIISVKSDTKVAYGGFLPTDVDNVTEGGTATIEGLNLGTCNLKDCGIYIEYPGDVESTHYYYDENTGQLIDNATHAPIDPSKLGRVNLLPLTGSWQDSWFNQGIVVKIPPIERNWEMEMNTPRYATLVVPIWPNGTNLLCLSGIYGDPRKGGGFQCTEYEKQTVIRYPVWLNVDTPGLSTIYSNPDYSNMLQANPHLSYWKNPNYYIPMYQEEPYVYGDIIVSGGDLLITGSNFGKDKGKVKIVFPEPLVPYINTTRPTWYQSKPGEPVQYPDEKWLPGEPRSDLPLDNITIWSDNAIKLTVPKVHGSYDVTPGYLYVQKANQSSNLWSWTPVSFSPRWVWQQVSGEGFFVGDFTNYGSSDNIENNVNHVLIVSHSKDCNVGQCSMGLGFVSLGLTAIGGSGDWGVDTLFKERPLPPNVKILLFDFYQFNPHKSIMDQLDTFCGFLDDFYDVWTNAIIFTRGTSEPGSTMDC
jgi:PKD repeat protein